MSQDNLRNLLHSEVADHEPAFSLTSAETIRAGRALRRRRYTVLGASVAVLVAAGVFGTTALGGGGSQPRPADSVPPEDVPKLIDQTIAEHLPNDAEVLDKSLRAYESERPLPREKWDAATGWSVEYQLAGNEAVTVEVLHAMSETEGGKLAMVRRFCRNDVRDGVYLTCDASRDPSGATVVEREWKHDQKGGSRARFQHQVETMPGGDYLIRAYVDVNARTIDQARSKWTLDGDQLTAIATQPDLLADPSSDETTTPQHTDQVTPQRARTRSPST